MTDGPYEGLFFSLKAAVLAIVLQAVVRIGRRALRNNIMVAIAAASFVAIYGFDVPLPLVVASAPPVDFLCGRSGHPAFRHGSLGASDAPNADTVLGLEVAAHPRPDCAWSLKVPAVLLDLWLMPTVLVAALGLDDVFSKIGVFFSEMAVVTFGGAHVSASAQSATGSSPWRNSGSLARRLQHGTSTLAARLEHPGRVRSNLQAATGSGAALHERLRAEARRSPRPLGQPERRKRTVG